MQQMGESGSNRLMRIIDGYLLFLYKKIPFTYANLYKRNFQDLSRSKIGVTLLDLGCGDGSAIASVGLSNNFAITGMDIFDEYLKLARKRGVYKRLIKGDIKKLSIGRKYDVVVANHILEHLTKKDGVRFLNKIEKIAKKRVIIALPIGNLPQDEYDENSYQLHRSAWLPGDFISRGYTVRSQGLKILWGSQNIVSKFGLFSYVLFVISTLSFPLLSIFPSLGTYMICRKDI